MFFICPVFVLHMKIISVFDLVTEFILKWAQIWLELNGFQNRTTTPKCIGCSKINWLLIFIYLSILIGHFLFTVTAFCSHFTIYFLIHVLLSSKRPLKMQCSKMNDIYHNTVKTKVRKFNNYIFIFANIKFDYESSDFENQVQVLLLFFLVPLVNCFFNQ